LDENSEGGSGGTFNKITILDAKPDDGILSQVLSSPSSPSMFDKIYGDVSDTTFIEEVIDRLCPDVIIHMAALQIPTCRALPLLGAKVNVLGTINIFEAVRKLRDKKSHLANIIYASSAAITGDPKSYTNTGIILDDTPHTPLNHYGVFKIANEGNARVYWYVCCFASFLYFHLVSQYYYTTYYTTPMKLTLL
jgi:nucleoside-diphosphate-sugar epimerase